MEYEAKFLLPHLAEIRKRILANGGHLLQERMLERNLRFDDPEGSLTATHQVLRLRQDREVTLTYKRGIERFESRIEIELQVDGFNKARHFLEALGYQVMHIYEKYRETFRLNHTSVMLDELPFGCFVEIEADSIQAVQTNAAEIGFRWGQRMQETYLALFSRLRQELELDFENATFANFEGLDETTRERVISSLSEFESQLE